jgi:dihydrolipoamide dehydrogenase
VTTGAIARDHTTSRRPAHATITSTSPKTDDDDRPGRRMIEIMAGAAASEMDVVVVGAGPAGLIAALRAARLGARTALVTRDAFGGMAAGDGPVPVRTLAYAARLMREARQLPWYGIAAGEPSLHYPSLLGRVGEVTADVRAHSLWRADLQRSGVVIHEHAGTARFVDQHVIESDNAPRLRAAKVIICTGGAPRRLDVPGSELTSTHSDAWGLVSAPASMVVIGAGATGIQVASIFSSFGTRVTVFELAPRILMSEDDDVADAITTALTAGGLQVLDDAGTIERFERCPQGVRLVYSKRGAERRLEAAVVVVAIGWVASTEGLRLSAAGVQTDARGFVAVDDQLRTTVPHIFAAGDITGRSMVVHEALRQAYLAATNAVLGQTDALPPDVSPIGSFTDPEYASVGLTEAAAREAHDVVVARTPFDALARPIIDGRTTGFCKLIAERHRHRILGCHIVGERAVELAQLAAIAISADMKVEQLALVPFSFPTYAEALGRAAVEAARELGLVSPGSGAFEPDDVTRFGGCAEEHPT